MFNQNTYLNFNIQGVEEIIVQFIFLVNILCKKINQKTHLNTYSENNSQLVRERQIFLATKERCSVQSTDYSVLVH